MVSKVSEEFKHEILGMYDDVRNDGSATNWCCLKYNEEATLESEGSGEDFEELKSKFGESDRCFAYLRVMTGDELSKRAKFVLLSWIGSNVGGLKKAKMSAEKALMKNIWRAFAVEFTFDTIKEVDIKQITEAVQKAGGANYGTGQ